MVTAEMCEEKRLTAELLLPGLRPNMSEDVSKMYRNNEDEDDVGRRRVEFLVQICRGEALIRPLTSGSLTEIMPLMEGSEYNFLAKSIKLIWKISRVMKER